jgi:hypothetical protein
MEVNNDYYFRGERAFQNLGVLFVLALSCGGEREFIP